MLPPSESIKWEGEAHPSRVFTTIVAGLPGAYKDSHLPGWQPVDMAAETILDESE